MLERTERKLAHDPIESAEYADPTEKAENAEPTDPIDRNEPTDPIENDDPDDAIEKNESFDQSENPVGRACMADILAQEQVVGAGLPATRSCNHCTTSSCAAVMTEPCVAPS